MGHQGKKKKNSPISFILTNTQEDGTRLGPTYLSCVLDCKR